MGATRADESMEANGTGAPDALEEACGVFAVYAPGEDVARLTAYGLQALQHRGQESAGIATGDGECLRCHKGIGLVTQVFDDAAMDSLTGHLAVGHVRYSTSGAAASSDAAQPHLSAIDDVAIALVHNGTLLDTDCLQRARAAQGGSMDTDTKAACLVIAEATRETGSVRQGIRWAMGELKGAYAMVLATPEALYAFRDPCGIRPLCIGRLPSGGWVVSSETCGLDIVGAAYVRDIEPGEVARLGAEGLDSELDPAAARRASCIFEYVYFARPDSVLDGQSVYQARRAMGRILADEAPVEADLVLGVPDSGVPAALGYSEASGIPFADGIVKNRYVGRTFIQPTQAMRQLGIRLKLNPLPSVITGKRLVVIDDSIVRGNTSKKLVQMLRDAGAAEVHLRIVSPEVLWPCFYGIDTDTREQLIAANMTLEEMNDWIGSDSLAFISLDGLRASLADAGHDGFCTACFTGDYPVPIPDDVAKKSFLTRKDFEAVYAGEVS